jgi:hypothetical protein
LRYLVVVSVVLLIAAPVAIGGPDALSIAKRALRLAKEPPAVTQYSVEQLSRRGTDGPFQIKFRCPQGMLAVAVTPNTPYSHVMSASVRGRRALVLYDYGELDRPLNATVTCAQGRLVPQTS